MIFPMSLSKMLQFRMSCFNFCSRSYTYDNMVYIIFNLELSDLNRKVKFNNMLYTRFDGGFFFFLGQPYVTCQNG